MEAKNIPRAQSLMTIDGRILDLGCGKNKQPGAIGLDINPLPGVDVLHEVKRGVYLPFPDNTFCEIYMTDFMEHVDDTLWLLMEVHRVAAPGAAVIVRYPHYTTPNAHSDITHKHHGLGIRVLEHIDPGRPYGRKYQYYTSFGACFPYKIMSITPDFPGENSGPIFTAINRSSRALYRAAGPDLYEHMIARYLPINNVTVEMRVLK